MSRPRIADTRPAAVEVEAGKTYYWCTCGGSKNQPFCDGSHAGTEFEPLAYKPDKGGKQFLCQCKRTNKAPLCDGSHKAITQDELDEQDGLRTVWYRVADSDDMQDGEVRPAQAGTLTLALTRMGGRYAALDNACPHQGGPLAEGSIEPGEGGQCWLRCPWHGWDFDPVTGKSPGSHDDGVDSTRWRSGRRHLCRGQRKHGAHTHGQRRDGRDDGELGRHDVFGMVGHSNLGLADAMRVQASTGELTTSGFATRAPRPLPLRATRSSPARRPRA